MDAVLVEVKVEEKKAQQVEKKLKMESWYCPRNSDNLQILSSFFEAA